MAETSHVRAAYGGRASFSLPVILLSNFLLLSTAVYPVYTYVLCITNWSMSWSTSIILCLFWNPILGEKISYPEIWGCNSWHQAPGTDKDISFLHISPLCATIPSHISSPPIDLNPGSTKTYNLVLKFCFHNKGVIKDISGRDTANLETMNRYRQYVFVTSSHSCLPNQN